MCYDMSVAKFATVNFAKETGSLVIDIGPYEDKGEVEVVRSDAEVIITLKGDKIVNVEVLLDRDAAERLSRLLDAE